MTLTLTPTTRLTMTRTLAIVIATKGLIITMIIMTTILSGENGKISLTVEKAKKKKRKENERYGDNGYVRRALGGISLVIIVITSCNQTQAAAPIYITLRWF